MSFEFKNIKVEDIEKEIHLKDKAKVMEKIIYHQRLQKYFLLLKMKQ